MQKAKKKRFHHINFSKVEENHPFSVKHCILGGFVNLGVFCGLFTVMVSGGWNLGIDYSSSDNQASASASLGMAQSPLGERPTEPTLGPSVLQLRLNCWVKNR
jgi:hypothetical protein